MVLIGKVDVLEETEVSGWVANESDLQQQLWVDVVVNSSPIARLKASLMRPDLQKAGIGDGRKAFRFDLSPYLEPGENAVSVRFADSGAVVKGGTGTIVQTGRTRIAWWKSDNQADLSAASQKRWKGTEPDADLTWGRYFTGESFLDAVRSRYRFDPSHHLCEIGPGYGRLLLTILERKLPFSSYTGVDLSKDRVRRLNAKFTGANIRHVQADVEDVRLVSPANAVLCSATFEHLFPDFTNALSNLVRQSVPGGYIGIDFIQTDPEMAFSHQVFEPLGNFVRHYSADEIRALFSRCGLVRVELSSIVLGVADFGEVKRIFASAFIPA